MKKNMKRKGFTLIELLVVIAIIGILAAVIVVNLNIARTKARDAKRKTDLASVQMAVEMYADRYGNYPIQTVNRNSKANRTDWVSNSGSILGFVPDFISVLPVDPRNTDSYVYFYWSDLTGSNYKLISRDMESLEGKDWARNDGGRADTWNRNICIPPDPPCPVTNCRCDYELFTAGAQSW